MLLTFDKNRVIKDRFFVLGLIYAALMLRSAAAQGYVGDACEMKDGAQGVCRVDKKCNTVLDSLKRREISVNDLIHCGFEGSDEIICCPTDMGPTTARTNLNSTVDNRIPERPSVEACRQIDSMLQPELSIHILDGTPVLPGEYPHMAAIGYTGIDNNDRNGPFEFRCGGTLIHRKFVLTAAHCVNSRDSKPAIVRLGVSNFSDTVEMQDRLEIAILLVHIHPNYSNSRKYDDIALLELERDVQFTLKIFPTCLYTDRADPPAQSRLSVTGWGTINTTTRAYSNVLLKARLTIVPLDSCNQSYVEYGLTRQLDRGLDETQLCAHDAGMTKDACQGDSGGPLNLLLDESLKMYRVVGVISTGFGCASSTPGLYTRVANYLDYIESIVWPRN